MHPYILFCLSGEPRVPLCLGTGTSYHIDPTSRLAGLHLHCCLCEHAEPTLQGQVTLLLSIYCLLFGPGELVFQCLGFIILKCESESASVCHNSMALMNATLAIVTNSRVHGASNPLPRIMGHRRPTSGRPCSPQPQGSLLIRVRRPDGFYRPSQHYWTFGSHWDGIPLTATSGCHKLST
jgi:hypothetical protein